MTLSIRHRRTVRALTRSASRVPTRLASAVAGTVLASAVLVAPAAAQVAVTTLTLTGPTTAVLGASRGYQGSLRLAGAGVPAQEVELRVDGAVAARTVTEVDGDYTALLTFPAYGGHDVQAVAHAGTPLETRSAVLRVEAVPGFDETAPTDVYDATRFIYTGPDAVQQGMAPGAVEPARVTVLRGSVVTAAGDPLDDVRVTVAGHPEWGHSSSRAGVVDMVVNGGEPLTVRFDKAGFLPVERQVDVSWRDYEVLPEVVLTPYDVAVTAVEAGAPETQVVRASEVSDTDGTRRATLVVPPDTAAVMELPDGSTQPLDTLHVRATEYTVGDTGPAAMPGELPPASGYTYAVDYTVDEAVAAGATEVRFDRPVPAYTENFRGFPAGTPVPAGYYDAARHSWVAAPDGRVIAVVGVTGGLADVDVDGDGAADTGSEVTDLGITDAERGKLAGLYQPGQTLWRVPVTHFTPWDYNWPYGLPEDAEPPGLEPRDRASGRCNRSGSVVGCENQTLGEELPVAGAPFSLVYDTSRVLGYSWARSLLIPLTGANPPASLNRVELEVSVTGRRFHSAFLPTPNRTHTFAWDGKDAYGRVLQGEQVATVRIGYVYPAVYYSTRSGFGASFARAGGAAMAGNRGRQEITLYQTYRRRIGGVSGAALHGLAGWTLSTHHAYDPDARTLHRGDGSSRPATGVVGAITRFAGTGAAGPAGEGTHTGDGGPASQAGLSRVHGLSGGPDGSLYLADTGNGVVRKIAPNGTITRFAGGGSPASGNGDGGPATSAVLLTPVDVAVAPGGDVYVLDAGAAVVRRVAPDGTISTVAGGGTPADGLGDDGAATAASFSSPSGIAVGAGALYVADTGHHRVRRIAADGVITTVAGGGTPADGLGDGLPGPQAKLASPADVAATADGRLYIADTDHNRIRLVRRDGQIETAAGNGGSGAVGDFGPATAAQIGVPTGVAVDPADGRVYVAQAVHHRVRSIEPSGVVLAVAGTGMAGRSGEQGPPLRAQLRDPRAVAVGRDGKVYVADAGNFEVRHLSTPLPGFALTDIIVPSSDSTEIYQFDATGRHLRTLDALTGAVHLEFGYDGAGRLVAIDDRFANRTTIEWNGAVPAAVVSPYGRRTTLEVGTDGYLSRVTNPANESVAMTYGGGGLLATFTGPRNLTSTFSYDAFGRLTKDEAADGNSTTLTRSETATGYRVVATTTAGRSTTYEIAVVGGVVTRTVIDPAGATSTARALSDGTIEAVDADGTVSRRRLGPDPRWGMQVPIPTQVTVTTPSGRTTTASAARTVVLSDPANLLSLRTQTDSLTFNGNTSTAVYDAITRTVTTTTAEGRRKVTTFDAFGVAVREQEGTLAPITFTYDSRGRLVQTTLGSGATARTATVGYDAAGDPVSEVDEAGEVVRTYDAVGRVLTATLPDGKQIGYGYDNAGSVTSITPPERQPHLFDFRTDSGVLDRYRPPAVAGSPDASSSYAYDDDRQSTSVVKPGGRTVGFGYDTAGRLESTTFSRGVIGYGYDAASRMTNVTGPGGESIDLAYDGYLVTRVTSGGTVTGDVSYGHDGNLRVNSRTIAGAGTTSYGYNRDGVLTSAGGLTLSWNALNGHLDSTALGSVSTSYGYNSFGEQISATATSGGTQLYGVSYTRDDVGRISSRTETVAGQTTTETYGYDARGRLTDVHRGGTEVAHYDYDGNGNRTLTRTPAGTVGAVHDAQDRLTTAGTTGYTYAAGGELATRTMPAGTDRYSYDELGNLVRAELADGTVVDYVVDPRGRRLAKKVNGTTVQRFVYGQGSLPIAELDGTGAVVATFVAGARQQIPDFMVKGGVTYRIVSDHTGSPRLVVNAATGAVAQRIDYDAYGVVTTDSNPGFQPFGFAGGIHDHHTGLVRLGSRDYDPTTGRFTAKDPIGFAGGDGNLYLYSGGDPVNLTDPTGLDWLQNLSDFAAGFGDAVTFGGTRAIRQLMGVDNVVDHCSGWYTGGSLTGEVVLTIITEGAGGARLAARGGKAAQVLKNKRMGDDVADAIARRYPGAVREVTLDTKSGVRRLDVLTPEGLAIESKVGRTSLTTDTRRQIARDVELLNDPGSSVKAIEWHFTTSPVTGKGGPTGPLRKALEEAGIRVKP